MQYLSNHLQYLQCSKKNHYNQPMSVVCADPFCQKRQILCCFCEELDHTGHQTQHLRQFLTQLFKQTNSMKGSRNQQSEHMNSTQQVINGLYYTKKVQNLLGQYMSMIEKKRQLMLQELQELETFGKNFFNSIGGILLQILTSQQKTLNLLKKAQEKKQKKANQQKLQNYLKKILRQINFQDDSKFSLQFQLDKLIELGQDANIKLESELKYLTKNLQQTSQRIKKNLVTDSFYENYKQTFKWSEDLKPKNKVISDEQLVISQATNDYSNQRFVMIDCNLSELNKKMKTKITWACKIIKCSSWIGVGICLKQTIIDFKYQFNYSTTGHGSYLLSSNGYTWSHSDKNYNSVNKGFSYGINDIIQMTFDYDALALIFTKYSKMNDNYVKASEYALSISKEDSLQTNPFYPCANLCSVGDKIEIVSQYK